MPNLCCRPPPPPACTWALAAMGPSEPQAASSKSVVSSTCQGSTLLLTAKNAAKPDACTSYTAAVLTTPQGLLFHGAGDCSSNLARAPESVDLVPSQPFLLNQIVLASNISGPATLKITFPPNTRAWRIPTYFVDSSTTSWVTIPFAAPGNLISSGIKVGVELDASALGTNGGFAYIETITFSPAPQSPPPPPPRPPRPSPPPPLPPRPRPRP